MTQQEAQQMNWQIATTWYEDTGLEYDGVSLGRVLEYEMLRVIGRVLSIFQREQEQNQNEVKL